MSQLPGNLLTFGRVLRRAGFLVHSGRLAELVEALAYVDLGARDDVYHVCRTLLVHRQDQIPVFDVAFAVFWRETDTPGNGIIRAMNVDFATFELDMPAGPGQLTKDDLGQLSAPRPDEA